MKDLGLDRISTISLVEAGYIPLRRYIELFGPELPRGADLKSLNGVKSKREPLSDVAHRPSWWHNRPKRDVT